MQEECGYELNSNYDKEYHYKYSNYIYICRCRERGIGLGFTPNDWHLNCKHGKKFNKYTDPWPKSYYNYVGEQYKYHYKKLVEIDFTDNYIKDKIVTKISTDSDKIGVWVFADFYLHFSKEKPLIISKLRETQEDRFKKLCDATKSVASQSDNLEEGIVISSTVSKFSPNMNIIFHLIDGSTVNYNTISN